jgi:ABC-2 type transport system ATP-binding protein
VIFSTHNIAEAERYAERVLVIADGQGLFDGTIAELHAAAPAAGSDAADFESAFVRFLAERGH